MKRSDDLPKIPSLMPYKLFGIAKSSFFNSSSSSSARCSHNHINGCDDRPYRITWNSQLRDRLDREIISIARPFASCLFGCDC
jgi:hypothetical protein